MLVLLNYPICVSVLFYQLAILDYEKLVVLNPLLAVKVSQSVTMFEQSKVQMCTVYKFQIIMTRTVYKSAGNLTKYTKYLL